MIFKRSDIYFAKDDSHRFLPWLVGVMACLATLLLFLGLALNGWIASHHAHYANSFTVTIPGTIEDLANKRTKITDLLKHTPGVTSITPFSDTELKEMLKPWLGNSDALDVLPLPSVLNVELENQTTVIDYVALEKTLAAIAAGTEVDAHERWVAAFSDFAKAAQGLMIILALLILTSIGAMIAFISRTSLKLHGRTVHLLHAIGAADSYIARQFQQEAFLLVLPGAVAGTFVAFLLYWLIGMYMTSLPVAVMPSLSIHMSHILLLLFLPPLCAVAAWLVARICVLKQLQSTL